MAKLISLIAFAGAMCCAVGLAAVASLGQGLIEHEALLDFARATPAASLANGLATSYFALFGIVTGIVGLAGYLLAPEAGAVCQRFLAWTGIVFGAVTMAVGVGAGILIAA